MSDENKIKEINAPLADSHYVVFSEGIEVHGEVGVSSSTGETNVTNVWAKVLRSDEDPPNDPMAAGWATAPVENDKTFKILNVEGGLGVAIHGGPNNKVVVIPELSDSTYGDPFPRTFLGRLPREEVAVSARDCIWFSFVTESGPVSHGPGSASDRETDVMQHKPHPVIVPDNVETMKADSIGRWRHYYASPDEDPDGCDNAEGCDNHDTTTLDDMGYRHANYGSDKIDNEDLRVGSLVAMFVEDPLADPMTPFTPVTEISGMDPTEVPENTVRLCLGSHDGGRWHNNSGAVVVTLIWELANKYRYKLRSAGLLNYKD